MGARPATHRRHSQWHTKGLIEAIERVWEALASSPRCAAVVFWCCLILNHILKNFYEALVGKRPHIRTGADGFACFRLQ